MRESIRLRHDQRKDLSQEKETFFFRCPEVQPRGCRRNTVGEELYETVNISGGLDLF